MKRKLMVYDYVLHGYESKHSNTPKTVAMNMDWSEIESSVQFVSHTEYLETINGVSIYYCYGTDTYLFADANY